MPREALGDAHHEPPVDDHRAGGGTDKHDLALDLAERDEEEARGVLPLGEAPDELPRLALGGVGQIGHAVEVDEDDAAAALHIRHAATGESMPPESSAATVPPEPTGRPPGPALRSE